MVCVVLYRAVNFEYENLNAAVLYSKIADSFLPAEIQGEKGTILKDMNRLDSAEH